MDKLAKFQDTFTKKVFGKTTKEAQKDKLCVCCHKPVKPSGFKDMASIREYGITGLCQTCQDGVFED